MAWLLNKSSTVGQASGTTVSTSFGALPAAGDRVFIFVGAFNAGGGAVTPTFSDNQGNSYTVAVLTYDGVNTGHGVWIAASNALIAAPSGTHTCTVASFAAASDLVIFALSFSGGLAGVADATASAQDLVGSVITDTGAAGNATRTDKNLILHASNYNGALTSITEPSAGTLPATGWVNAYQELGAGGQTLDVNFVIATATVTPRYEQVISPSEKWFTVLASFKPAAVPSVNDPVTVSENTNPLKMSLYVPMMKLS